MRKSDADQMKRNVRLERAADQLHDVILDWFQEAKGRGIIETRVKVAAWLVRLAEGLDGELFPHEFRGRDERSDAKQGGRVGRASDRRIGHRTRQGRYCCLKPAYNAPRPLTGFASSPAGNRVQHMGARQAVYWDSAARSILCFAYFGLSFSMRAISAFSFRFRGTPLSIS